MKPSHTGMILNPTHIGSQRDHAIGSVEDEANIYNQMVDDLESILCKPSGIEKREVCSLEDIEENYTKKKGSELRKRREREEYKDDRR